MTDSSNMDDTHPLPWQLTLLICVGILLLATIVTGIIQVSEPTAERTGATKETAMLVETTPARRGSYRPMIEALGRVEPALEVMLSPRVSGEIIARHAEFVPGGFVKKGERLLQIDPADYENALMERRGELRRAEAELAIEQGRQDVAAQEYELLGETLTGENEALVLRKPQLNAARAAVESARAAVRQAELNLGRSLIDAPFDAQILSRNANVGSQVASGDILGRLIGTEAYWVIATVPLAKLPWIEVPEGEDETGSPVRLRHRAAWPEDVSRQGRVTKLIGSLDEETRLARLLVTVHDPLARTEGVDDPPLIIDAMMHLSIEGREIADVVRLNRDYLRAQDNVWVMQDGKLEIRRVHIAFRDADHAYIHNGLNEGEQIVTTNLATVAEGVPLRTEGASSEDAPAQQQEAEK